MSLPLPLSVPQRHFVWLCPTPDSAQRFATEISSLSSRAGTVAFPPHVTLIGELATAPDDTLRACRTAFAGLGAVRAEVAGLTKTDAYYMALFLDLTLFPPIDAIRADILRDLGEVAGPPPRPHLSLAYGLSPDALTLAETRALQERFREMEFELDRVAVVAAAKDAPVSTWKEICNASLH